MTLPHSSRSADIWERIEDLLARYDGDFKVDVASQSMWGATLRLATTNPPGEPSRSITFFSVAGQTPEEVATKVYDDANRWLADGNTALPLGDRNAPF